jgi:hypothetical protein
VLGGERDRLPLAPGVDQLRDPQRLRFGGFRRPQQGAAAEGGAGREELRRVSMTCLFC